MLPAAHTLPFASDGQSSLLIGGGIVLRGWSLRNPADATSTSVVLIDGSNDDGAEIAWVDLLPSESTREWFSGDGIAVLSGLWIAPQGDPVIGTLYYSPGTLLDGLMFVDGALGTWTGQV